MPAMSHMLRGVMAQEYHQVPLRDSLEAAGKIAENADLPARAQLWLLQMLLPDLVSAVEKVIVEASDQPRARSVAGGLLTYVYNPLDLIGDDTPLGRLDDAIVCAIGLRRLSELGEIQLDENTGAICDLAARGASLLNRELREAIEWFVRDLEQSTDPSAPRSRP